MTTLLVTAQFNLLRGGYDAIPAAEVCRKLIVEQYPDDLVSLKPYGEQRTEDNIVSMDFVVHRDD